MSSDETYTELVAAEVRAAVARNKVRQAVLAEALNMSQAGVSRRLTGAVSFSASELYTVARVIGVPVTSLLPLERSAS